MKAKLTLSIYSRSGILRLAACVATICLPWPVSADAPGTQTAYYGVYLKQAKLGSAVMTRNDHALLNGRPTVEVDMTMTMDLHVFGADSEVRTGNRTWSDPKTGTPLESKSHSESAGRVTDVTAVYSARSLTYTADVQGTKKTETLALKPGEQFLVDPSDGADIKPKAGERLTGKIFSPDLLKLLDAEVDVLAKETVIIDGQATQAYRILEKNPLEPATVWASDDGDLLRIDLPLGMQLIRQTKDAALATPGKDSRPPDLIAMTSIAPTGKSLTDSGARTAKEIVYEIGGVTRPLPPDDSVQSVTYSGAESGDKGARTATVAVHPHALPDAPAAARFARPEAAPERLRPYLRPTVYVSSGDAAFIDLARKIVGSETDSAKAAAKIATYVHKTIRYDPEITALRTADDIRRAPRGVCRDYTTFFTAIARAAGIPTKQCVGLGFGLLPNGTSRFVGHAWPEVWVGQEPDGSDRWVALEPTWGIPFADATHIKLAEGEITDFFAVAGDLTSYRIKVLAIK